MFFGLFPSKEWRAFKAEYRALEKTLHENPYQTPTQFNLLLSEKYLEKHLAGEGVLPHPFIIKAFVSLAVSSYETEVYINSLPQVDLRLEEIPTGMERILDQLAARIRDKDIIYNETVNAFAEFFQRFSKNLPEVGRYSFRDFKSLNPITFSLIDILPEDPKFLPRCLAPLFSPNAQIWGFFNSLQLPTFDQAAARDRPENTRAVSRFVKNPLLKSLLAVQLPLTLTTLVARFEGTWIIAPPGRGKTNLLHKQFLEDVRLPASLILMDSKGDFIDPIRRLKIPELENRLVIIDPNQPLALNPLDMRGGQVHQTVSLLEYLFSALLEAKMTALQATLFRSVLRALVESIPNATLATFRDIITNGIEKYKEHLHKLDPDLQNFFHNEFDSRTYSETRQQLTWRLRLLLDNDVIKAMFSSPKTKLDIGREMDAGKVIIINNSKALLGEEGSEFFGRFFIALVLSAAQQRSRMNHEDKLPCYFTIDECHTVIRRDEKIATILDECRSQKIALTLAHQRLEQIVSPNVLGALSNCAVRFANSDDDAAHLAARLRTTPEHLRSLSQGSFVAFIRDQTKEGLTVRVPLTNLRNYPQLSSLEQKAISYEMKERYGHRGYPEVSPVVLKAAEDPSSKDWN